MATTNGTTPGGGGRLRVDADECARAAREIRMVLAGLEREDACMDSVADHVGHVGVRRAVGGFASSWDVTRGRLATHLALLADHLEATAQTFSDIDRRLAAGLTPGAQFGGGGV